MNIRVVRLGCAASLLVFLCGTAAAQAAAKQAAGPANAASEADKASTPASQTVAPTPALVDLNSASEEVLRKLPGISAAEAKLIVEDRKNRPYKDKEDLVNRRVLPIKTYEKIKHLIVAAPVKK